jgi:hypothetical protein
MSSEASMLYEFIKTHHDLIIARAGEKRELRALGSTFLRLSMITAISAPKAIMQPPRGVGLSDSPSFKAIPGDFIEKSH